MIKYISLSLSVAQSRFIRFMSAGFFVCLILAVSLFVLALYKILKNIGDEEKHENITKYKLVSINESYECQSCGNRKVTDSDKDCGVCGITFADPI